MSVVVVVLPSEPVTAMILHGQTAKNASISLVTTAPASRSCLSAGMSGCMPGVRKTISACTPSKYPSPTWSVAPSRSSSRTSRYTATRVPVQVLAQDDTMSAVSVIGAGEFVITTSTKPIEAGTQVKLADNG